MIAVLQRVNEASVKIDGKVSGAINEGLMVLTGIENLDTEEDLKWLAQKIVNLRIFNDEGGG